MDGVEIKVHRTLADFVDDVIECDFFVTHDRASSKSPFLRPNLLCVFSPRQTLSSLPDRFFSSGLAFCSRSTYPAPVTCVPCWEIHSIFVLTSCGLTLGVESLLLSIICAFMIALIRW